MASVPCFQRSDRPLALSALGAFALHLGVFCVLGSGEREHAAQRSAPVFVELEEVKQPRRDEVTEEIPSALAEQSGDSDEEPLAPTGRPPSFVRTVDSGEAGTGDSPQEDAPALSTSAQGDVAWAVGEANRLGGKGSGWRARRRGVYRSDGSGLLGGGARSTGARLRTASAQCSDLFPASVPHEVGQVAVVVDVDPRGLARFADVQDESTPGFRAAARHCTERLRFEPAHDDAGKPIAARAVVRLSFRRRG